MTRIFLGAASALVLAACGGTGETGQDTPGPVAEPAPPKPSPRSEMAPAPDGDLLPQRLASGAMSPREAVGIYLRRIELLDDSGPRIQSVIALNGNAVSEAQQLENALAAGEEPGPLFGLPILVKDNIEVAGMATTAGSTALLANDTDRDAPAIARLREADAIILGKTNLSEWANFRSSQSISGWSSVGGLTRNPHDLSRNACGSSSGSGAAVAAGLAWAALGTETNGSVTCPAAMNGIVGFKPTVGLISRRHVVPISPTQDTIGPMTTSVRDAAMLLAVMAGTDPEDDATAEADDQRTDYVAALDGASLEGVRLGVLRWAEASDPREKAVFDEALARAEEAGAVLVEIEEFGGESFGGDAYTVLKAEFRDALNAYLQEAAEGVETRTLSDIIAANDEDPRALALFGQDILKESDQTDGMKGEDYRSALSNVRRGSRTRGMDRLLGENDVDALIAPSFGPAFMIDTVRGDIIASDAGAGWLAAIAGYPHLTIPMGNVRGLPLGLSVMGGAWEDAEVLAIGQAFEDILPPRLEPTFRLSADADEASAPYLEPATP